MAINPLAVLEHTQKIVSDGKAVIDLPRQLDNIREKELWRHWRTASGKQFKTFAAAVSARQPHGIGLGQYHGWITASQAYELCDGFSELQKKLRPLIGREVKPVAKNGTNQHSKRGRDNVTPSGRGNSKEYLLGVLKRDHRDIFDKWCDGEFRSVRQAAIKAGIIKVKDTDSNRCPVDRLKMYWKRATKKQRREFLKWVDEQQ